MLSRRTNLQAIASQPEPRIALDVAASLVAGTTLVTDAALRVLRKQDGGPAFAPFLGTNGDQYFFKQTRHRKEFDALMAAGATPSADNYRDGDRDGRVCSRSFFGDEGNETLIKLRRIDNDNGALVIVSLIGITAFRKFDDVLLRQLYGLTAAESRVATYLYNGICIKEIAERNNASVATVRDQLSSVFQKTRVNSQPKLVALLGRLELLLA